MVEDRGHARQAVGRPTPCWCTGRAESESAGSRSGSPAPSCASIPGPDRAGACRSCHLLDAGSHPDFLRIEPAEGESAIPIGSVRDLIDRFTLAAERARVAVIAPAEAMNQAAANAFLKTLEEPAGRATFILASDAPGRLPATIRSRCRKMAAPAPPDAEALEWLETKTDPAIARHLLALSGGAPLAALELGQRHDKEALLALHAETAALLGGAADPIEVAGSCGRSETGSSSCRGCSRCWGTWCGGARPIPIGSTAPWTTSWRPGAGGWRSPGSTSRFCTKGSPFAAPERRPDARGSSWHTGAGSRSRSTGGTATRPESSSTPIISDGSTSARRRCCGVSGWNQRSLREEFGIVGTAAVDANARFTAPVSYGDLLRATSFVERWGTSSFTVYHRLDQEAEVMAVEGREVRIWAKRGADGRLRAEPVPAAFRRLLG